MTNAKVRTDAHTLRDRQHTTAGFQMPQPGWIRVGVRRAKLREIGLCAQNMHDRSPQIVGEVLARSDSFKTNGPPRLSGGRQHSQFIRAAYRS